MRSGANGVPGAVVVILLGVLPLHYFLGRLEGAPIAHTTDWNNGVMVGGIGGALTALGWIFRTVRRHGQGIVPWQWFTGGLLLLSSFVPQANPGRAGRRQPIPPVTSFEDVAMITYTITGVIGIVVVLILKIFKVRAEPDTPPVIKRIRVRPAPSKHKQPQRRRKRRAD